MTPKTPIITAAGIRTHITSVIDADGTAADQLRSKLNARANELKAQIQTVEATNSWSDWGDELWAGEPLDLAYPARVVREKREKLTQLRDEFEYVQHTAVYLSRRRTTKGRTTGARLAYLAETLDALVAQVRAVAAEHPEMPNDTDAMTDGKGVRDLYLKQSELVNAYAELRKQQHAAVRETDRALLQAVGVSGQLRDATEHQAYWIDLRRQMAADGTAVTRYSPERWAWFTKARAPRWADVGQDGYPVRLDSRQERWGYLVHIATEAEPFVPLSPEELSAAHDANVAMFDSDLGGGRRSKGRGARAFVV